MSSCIRIIASLAILLLGIPGYSQDVAMPIIVKTNGAKITETLDPFSKTLAVLKSGQKLDLIGIEFPSGSSTQRFFVNYNDITGYVSSYFIQDNDELKVFILQQKRLFLAEQQRVTDSLSEKKKREDELYLARFKIDEEAEIRKNDSVAEAMLGRAKIESREISESLLKEREEKFQSRKDKYVKKYGASYGEKIARETIWIGMTEEMLLDSWGYPKDINRTVTKYMERKQYVYSNSTYVYVENGKVTAWQD